MKTKKVEIPIAITPAELVEKVYNLVAKDDLKYVEAVIEVCEEQGIDYYDIAPLIKGPLKSRLELEAMKFNSLPDTRGNTLFSM